MFKYKKIQNPFLSRLGLFSRNIAIDLGTANTLVYLENSGIVLNEPSVVALTDYHGSSIPYAFGHEAKIMLGRAPADIRVVRPLKDGVIADFRGAEEMIKYFISSVHSRNWLIKPLIIVCVPYGSTPVERRAIQDAALSAGARDAFLIEELMSAAIGAKLPITEPTGSMIIDIGGGTTEIGIISLGGIVTAKSIRVGGNTMDEAIIAYVRKQHNLLIGDSTAEKIKKNIGSAQHVPSSEERSMAVKGRDLVTGIPREVILSENQIVESLSEAVNAIVSAVLLVLELAPPELASDIAERGMCMTGGGSLVSNLDKVLHAATGLSVTIAEEALHSVVLGMGAVLERMPELKHVLFKQD